MLPISLNHKEIGKYAAKTTKIKPLRNKYKWEGINVPSEKDELKKFEKNNVTIAFNVVYLKKDKIYPTYASKRNSNREKQVILLMIRNEEKWHYLAVKKLSALLTGITSKPCGDIFFAGIVFIPLVQKTNLNGIKEYAIIEIFVTL